MSKEKETRVAKYLTLPDWQIEHNEAFVDKYRDSSISYDSSEKGLEDLTQKAKDNINYNKEALYIVKVLRRIEIDKEVADKVPTIVTEIV